MTQYKKSNYEKYEISICNFTLNENYYKYNLA